MLYAKWFAALKAKWPHLLWVNNLVDTLEPSLINISNGRKYTSKHSWISHACVLAIV